CAPRATPTDPRGKAPAHRVEAGSAGRQRPTGESPRPPPDGRRAGSRKAPSHLPPREAHDDGDAEPRARPDERPGHGRNPAVSGIHLAADRGARQEERRRKVRSDYAQLRINAKSLALELRLSLSHE